MLKSRPAWLQVVSQDPGPESGVGWVLDGTARALSARGWNLGRVSANSVAVGRRGRTYAAVPLALARRARGALLRLPADVPVVVEINDFQCALVPRAVASVQRTAPTRVLYRTHGMWRAAVALLGADVAGLPPSTHGTFKNDFTYGLMESLAVRGAHGVVVQSGQDLEWVRRVDGFPPAATLLAPSGIAGAEEAQLRSRTPPEAAPLRLVWAGRESYAKASDVIRELAAVIADREDLQLTIVGLIAPSTRAVNLDWRGTISRRELGTIVSTADAFLWPSRYEGFGLAPFEAMALGCPVVGTASGGLADHLVDGANGVRVDAPTVDALREAVDRFVAMRAAERARLRRGAVATASQLTWAKHGEAMDRFARELLRRPTAGLGMSGWRGPGEESGSIGESGGAA